MTFFYKNAVIGLAEILCRLPLIFTVGYLARNVGAEVFGNWALIVTLQVFIAGCAGLGLSSSLSRFVPASTAGEASAQLRRAFLLSAGPLFVVGILIYALAAPIGRLLGIRPDMDWLLPLAALMAAGSVADGYLDAFFKGRMAIGRQVLFVASRTVIEVVAVVSIFVVTSSDVSSAPRRLADYICIVAIGKTLLYPLLLSGLLKGGESPPREARLQFLKYGLPMVPTVLALWLVAQSDRLVLSHFVNKADLGVYVFGASLAAYVVFLGYAVYPLLLPAASRLHDQGDAAAVAALFQDSQKLFVVLWAGGMAFLALWSADIINWTGGHAFAGAAPVLLILSFALGLDQLMGVYQYTFHLVKRTDLILWLNAGYAALMIVCLTVAGYAYGIALAPWAALTAAVLFNLLRYRVARRYLPIALPDWLVVEAAAVAVLTAALAVYGAGLNIGARAALTTAILVPLTIFALRNRANGGLATP